MLGKWDLQSAIQNNAYSKMQSYEFCIINLMKKEMEDGEVWVEKKVGEERRGEDGERKKKEGEDRKKEGNQRNRNIEVLNRRNERKEGEKKELRGKAGDG